MKPKGGSILVKQRILVVDDEENIRRLLSYSLGKAGYDVTEARNGADALNAVGIAKPDLIVLDVMMPVMDGNEVVMRLKANPQTAEIPVILLSARTSDVDKVYGLDIGADDYVTKPFSVNELIARIKARLRRLALAGGKDSQKDLLVIGNIRMDNLARKAYVDEKEISLTLKEYELLFYLSRHAGTAFSREKLMDEVWGSDFYGDTRTVDVHITHLRAKLGIEASKALETVRGIGYRMAASGGKG